METLSAQTIRDELAKADALLASQDLYSAVARLGLLAAALGECPDTRSALSDQIDARMRDIDMSMLHAASARKADRLRRALTYGDRFTFEELVLALTIRIELAAVLMCARMFRPGDEIGMELGDCDEALREIAKVPSNRKDYRAAVSSIQRNWRDRIPFDTRALGVAELFVL